MVEGTACLPTFAATSQSLSDTRNPVIRHPGDTAASTWQSLTASLHPKAELLSLLCPPEPQEEEEEMEKEWQYGRKHSLPANLWGQIRESLRDQK